MIQSVEGDLDRALAGAGDGAFATTGDGTIILWNRAAERMLGYTADEAVGRHCCDLLVGRDGNDNRLCCEGCRVLTLVAMGDAVESFDVQTRTRSGSPIWLNVSILTITGGAGGPAVIHLFRDVTAAREMLTSVRERAAPAGAPDSRGELTRRELEVLRLIVTGADTRTAAEQLQVSAATVRNHVQNILGKLHVHSRIQAVAYATTHRRV